MNRSIASRRAFLQTISRAGAGAVVASATIQTETARGFAANDEIAVGCLGTGGRCRGLMRSLAQIPGVRIAAVCDIYDPHLEEARTLADPGALATKNYHEVLARDDIDAVLIGSPDHWHVPMTVNACDAGKDVYVEKPLTHNLEEGQAVIDAQNRHHRIVQVGTQQRSMPHFQTARELLKAGRIGRVLKVHLSWNRNTGDRMRRGSLGIDPNQVDWKAFLGAAPDQPFDEFRFRNWRWFWDFGGGLLTDLMVHFIDVVHWFLDVEHPETATTLGQHFAAEGLWETPDTIQCLLAYPEKVQAHFEGTFSNARYRARVEFLGTDATLYLDRGGYQIFPERPDGEYEELILGTDPRRGLDFYDHPDGELLHLTNWVECIRTRAQPTCPAEAGVSASAAAHLGNIAYRTAQVARWEDVARNAP